MIEIRRILCPIDSSGHSRRAFDHAIAVARWYDSTVNVLHVFSSSPVAVYGLAPICVKPLVLTDVERDQLLARVKAFVGADAAPGINVDAAIRKGEAVAEILKHAKTLCNVSRH